MEMKWEFTSWSKLFFFVYLCALSHGEQSVKVMHF